MARMNDGILLLTEAEALATSAWLSHGAQKAVSLPAQEALGMLGDELLRQVSKDPFDGRRFVIEIEQTIRRC